jgi:serine/threonine protein kinase
VSLDRYEHQAFLGRGAAGTVYRARDTKLGREVAIKILHPSTSATQAKRFDREAQALARLRHPHVVELYDYGESPQGPFLVMEFFPGESLRAKLEREGVLPQRLAARLVHDLARAIQHAHDKNLLHRDLKPANVLLGPDESVKVTDFGLARDVDPSTSRSQLTESGTCLGTPGYWSPEQARGDPVSPATDVYGLGAVLYACLTGRAPYVGEHLLHVMLVQASTPVDPPSSMRDDLDPELEAICLRSLEKDPGARYPSADALAKALGDWLRRASAPAALHRGPLSPALAAALSLAVGALLLGLALRSPPPGDEAHAAPPSRDPVSEPAESQPNPYANSDDAVFLTQEIQRHALAQQYDLALAAVNRALELEPGVTAFWDNRATLHAALGEFERAIDDATHALTLNPADPKPLTIRAQCHASRGDHDKAIQDYRALVERDQEGRSLALYRSLTALGLDLGDPPAVEVSANTHDPGRSEALLRQAWALVDAGDTDGAVLAAEAAVAAAPSNASAWATLGRMRVTAGDPSGLDDTTKAIELDPTHADGYFYRGQARAHYEDWDAALEDLKTARALSDTERVALVDQMIVDIERARGE